MAKKQDYDWLDDAFDDAKNEEEMREATRSRNRGCLLVAACFVVILVIAVGTVVLSFFDLIG